MRKICILLFLIFSIFGLVQAQIPTAPAPATTTAQNPVANGHSKVARPKSHKNGKKRLHKKKKHGKKKSKKHAMKHKKKRTAHKAVKKTPATSPL